MLFTKLLTTLLLANAAAMVLANLFSLRVAWLLWLYPLLLLLAAAPVWRARCGKAKITATWGMRLFAGLYGLALVALRLPYLMDCLPGVTVNPSWDDYARVPELLSMTLSPDFPLRHFANPNYLFSFYYCSLFPAAFLKLAAPALSLLNCVFFWQALYVFLILFSLIEILTHAFKTRASLWAMLFLCTLYGGFDWLAHAYFGKGQPLSHHEWWQHSFNLALAQISSFFTALHWTSHHFMGFYSLVVACAVFTLFRFSSKNLKFLLVGLLLISAFYSSVFSAAPFALLLLLNAKAYWRMLRKRPLLAVALVFLFLTPLYVLTNKLPGHPIAVAPFAVKFTGSFALNKLLSFPVWLGLVTLVELALIPFFCALYYRRFAVWERKAFIASWLYYLSTYVLLYSSCNNYSMRGMLLPSFVFFFLFSKYAMAEVWPRTRRLVLLCAVALSLFGTMTEYLVAAKIARDLVRSKPGAERLAEERFGNKPLEDMAGWEKELLRLPRTHWLY
jgi:hypothetical protein